MKLSILDQVPLTEHATTAGAALSSGLQLAQDADALGYHRIWFAEHHHSKSFASAAPEMMTALALERTSRIRVGTGAILLPYYQAQKVAESMGLLAAVHPGGYRRRTCCIVRSVLRAEDRRARARLGCRPRSFGH